MRSILSSWPVVLGAALCFFAQASCGTDSPLPVDPDPETPCTTKIECVTQVGNGFICGEDGVCVEGCEDAHDCEWMGAGHMCMSNMCMVMDPYGPEVVQPEPSEQDIEPVTFTDLDPSDEVYEITLVAAEDELELVPGTLTQVYVYKESLEAKGTIPGPVIDAVVGTRVIIHFTNHLPEPTTVHWHGIRLPANMDGVANISQAPVEPGGSYTYDFLVPDAALFWYHPHFRSDVQVERGLYGLFRVRETEEPVVNRTRLFTLDDILLDEDGQVEPVDTAGAHFFQDGLMKMTFTSMMGRQGNLLLLNGKANPIIHVKKGHVERWRFANTSNARFFRVALEGHGMRVIGYDGGFIEFPEDRDDILVGNAERRDVIVVFDGEPGQDYVLANKHYNRGHDLADPGDQPLALIRYDDEPADDGVEIPDTSVVIPPLDAGDEPHHIVKMGEIMLFADNAVGFTLNGDMWPDITPQEGVLGDVELWEVNNATDMDHPFHMHGHFFEVKRRKLLGEDWVEAEAVILLDTVTILPGEIIQFAVAYNGFVGEWVYHCHNFEHAKNGMMGKFIVSE